MKVALLGHTGFLGQNVAQALTADGIEFAAASRVSGVDLRDVGQAADFLAAARPDVILHCAAHVGSFNYVTENAAAVLLDNSRLVLSVYEAAARVCPRAVLVHPLANCVYPATAQVFHDAAWQDGPVHSTVLPFATTRRLAWAAGESFRLSHAMRSISLLVPNMYGPFDSLDPNQTAALDALVSRFVTAKQKGLPLVTIWGSGIAVREWIFAPDMARLLLEVARNPTRPGLDQPLNMAQNAGISIRDLAEIIRQYVGYEGEVRYDTTKPDGALKKVMDDEQFRKVFPEFEFTSFEKGLAATVTYYQSVI